MLLPKSVCSDSPEGYRDEDGRHRSRQSHVGDGEKHSPDDVPPMKRDRVMEVATPPVSSESQQSADPT